MLKLENISVELGDFSLKDISLELPSGEYHVLLGPSGSGKTVLLNTIAGFNIIGSGKILLDNTDLTKLPANKRNISLLFQDLALFPHLSVFENVAFSLKGKKLDKKTIEERVDKYLAFTEISDLKYRKIDKLSGGEKQRLAIARILVTETKVLMLDEPFSAIDTQLKISLKKLLKKISNIGVSIIHVTHNYEEALNLADKISVIENGRIIQTGDIVDVLDKPESKFTASFGGRYNYFDCSEFIELIGKYYAIVQTENIKLSFQIPVDKILDYKGIIVDSNKISIVDTLEISGSNVFRGIVKSIFQTKNSFEIEIGVGVDLWINIPKEKYNSMDISIDDDLVISFETSAIDVF
jgi:ABC-type Fe3+/spermidine/putrescine transport system ATPase subunit